MKITPRCAALWALAIYTLTAAIVFGWFWRKINNDYAKARSSVDLAAIRLSPSHLIPVAYVESSRSHGHVSSHQALVEIHRSHDTALFPRLTLIAYAPQPRLRRLGAWEVAINQDGWTFWGDPENKYLVNGVNITRFPKLGLTKTRGVTWVDSHRRREKDLCVYGASRCANGDYLLRFRFHYQPEVDFVLSSVRSTLTGIRTIRP